MEFSTLILIFATMKLQTPVTFPSSRIPVTHGDRIMAVGSCFADQIGNRLVQGGFSACVNPFGTLYNPVSIAAAPDVMSAATEPSARLASLPVRSGRKAEP